MAVCNLSCKPWFWRLAKVFLNLLCCWWIKILHSKHLLSFIDTHVESFHEVISIYSSYIMVSWPYSQSSQLLASCCGFHEHHHWHLQEILQLGHQSASRLSLRCESTGNFSPKNTGAILSGDVTTLKKPGWWICFMFLPAWRSSIILENIAWFVQYIFLDHGRGWHLWSAL